MGYQLNHKLIITFSNAEINSPYLKFPIYQKLNDLAFCATAKAEHGTVIWDDEIDFDSDTLYIESRSLSTTVA